MTDTITYSKERIRCNVCNFDTWHQLLARQAVVVPFYSYETGELTNEVEQRWEILQCLGCDHVTVRVATAWSGDNEPDYSFYPERTWARHPIKQYQKLPTNLENLYIEVVKAYNSESLLLCAAGIRSLLEGLCDDKGIVEGPNEQGKLSKTLEGKINGLASIVPPGIVKNLHGLRFLGNQALHQLEIPSKSDLGLALNVIEDILNVVYDLNYKSQILYEKATQSRSSLKSRDESLPKPA